MYFIPSWKAADHSRQLYIGRQRILTREKRAMLKANQTIFWAALGVPSAQVS